MTKSKQKRKQAPNRYRRPIIVLTGLVVLVAISVALYSLLSPQQASDIIVMRYNDNVANIYKLDIDNPEADPIALTDYQDDKTAQDILISDDTSFVIYFERTTRLKEATIMRLEIASGETAPLHECQTDCWFAHITDDGRYMSFLEYADTTQVVKILPTSGDGSAMVLENSAYLLGFADNHTVEYVTTDNTALAYHLDTGTTTEISMLEIPSIGTNSNFSLTGGSVQFRGDLGTIAFSDTGSTDTGDFVSNSDIISQMMIPTNNPDYSLRMDVTPNVVKAYLIDLETETETLILDQSQYIIREIAWNADGTQFAFSATLYNSQQLEGELWIYDLETEETIALNQVGYSVQWLH